jgi:hypothetical protein
MFMEIQGIVSSIYPEVANLRTHYKNPVPKMCFCAKCVNYVNFSKNYVTTTRGLNFNFIRSAF